MLELEGPWHKPNASGAQGDCVEARQTFNTAVQVRDSADPDGPRLFFSPSQWDTFVAAVKAGEYDRAPS